MQRLCNTDCGQCNCAFANRTGMASSLESKVETSGNAADLFAYGIGARRPAAKVRPYSIGGRVRTLNRVPPFKGLPWSRLFQRQSQRTACALSVPTGAKGAPCMNPHTGLFLAGSSACCDIAVRCHNQSVLGISMFATDVMVLCLLFCCRPGFIYY